MQDLGQSWATTKRTWAGNGPEFLILVKVGRSPTQGRLERVEPVLQLQAAEASEMAQGDEGKPGFAGTGRGNLVGSLDSSIN